MTSSDSVGPFASGVPRGACYDEDPELFFPISASGPALRQISAAKAVCSRCTERPACLSHALTIQAEGIWGGTTEEERHAIPRSFSPGRMALSGTNRVGGQSSATL